MLADNTVVRELVLYLTPTEARDLMNALASMLGDPVECQHEHVYDGEYKGELTATVYVAENLHLYDERSRRLIETGS